MTSDSQELTSNQAESPASHGISRRTFAATAAAAGVAAAGVQAASAADRRGLFDRAQIGTPGEPIDYLFPVTEEKVTFRILVPSSTQIEDFETNDFTLWMEEKSNVHVEWEVVPQEEMQTSLNVRLAGGDLPDIIMNFTGTITPALLQLYGSQGLFIPLNDLIEEHATEFKRVVNEYPLIMEAITATDGNIYSIPELNDCFHCSLPAKLWVYKPWLEKLGKEIPTTPEEYADLLRAIRDEDPNGNGKQDEVPLTTWVTTTAPAGQFPNYTMNVFQYAPNERLYLKDGTTVTASFAESGWRDALAYYAGLYQEGLIPPQSFTQDATGILQMGNNTDDVLIGTAPALYPGQLMDIDSIEGGRWTDYIAIPPLKNPDGTQYTPYYPYQPFQISKLVITSACKNPEVAVKWADTFFNLEMTMRSQEGNLDEQWRWATEDEVGIDGQPAIWKRLVSWDGSQNFCWRQHAPSYRSNTFRLGEATDPADADHSLEPILYRETKNNYEPYKAPAEWAIPPLFFTPEDSETIADAKSTIDAYVNETMALAITGQLDINAEWENYLSTLEAMGLPGYLEVYQRTFDLRSKS